MIIAELFDGCPLRCELCWNRNRKGSMKSMPLEIVEAVIKKYGDAPRIDWYNWGEPLLHKNFVEVAKMVVGTASTLSSSLSFHVGEDKFEAIHNFRPIVVSLSGLSAKVYEVYHKGGDFDLVMKNLIGLAQDRRNAVIVKWLRHRQNVWQFHECQQLCKRFGMGFWTKPLNCEVEENIEGFEHELLKTGYPQGRKDCNIIDDILIDVEGNYLLCCASHNVQIGLHIKDDVEPEEIKEAKLNTALCKECHERGLWRMY